MLIFNKVQELLQETANLYTIFGIIQILVSSEKLWPDTNFLYVCIVTLSWRYNIGLRSWHTLGSWITIVWNIIQIKHYSSDLCPMQCSWLDLEDMSLFQDHDTHLGHEKQFCEILSRSNKTVERYDLDKDFPFVCHVTLTLKITHPRLKYNNYVNFYLNTTWQYWLMAQTMCSVWPWPWRYNLGSRSWHTLGLWQQLCEIVSKSNITVVTYGPDKNHGYVYSVTLTP